MGRTTRGWLGMALLATTAAAGCGGSSNTGSGHLTSEYVSGVRSSDGALTATFRSGNAPSAGSDPAVAASTSGLNILGGSKIIDLTAVAAFTRAVIAVEGSSGFYELLDLPSASAASLALTLTQRPPGNTFNLLVAVGTGTTSLGAYRNVPVTLTTVGTGDVQVSVTWDVDTDVDLHVLDPGNEEIFYAHRASASGGSLDLDSNAGCGIDGKKNENVTWPAGGAPAGTYKVLLDYWQACGGAAQTKYVVTINVKGQASQTFSGTLTGPGDQGGNCFPSACGVPIATFTR